MTLLLILLLSAPAHAQFAERMSGPYVDVAGGLGMGGTPFRPGIGWMAGFGWWGGRYDTAYAIGRYNSIGLNLRQDWLPSSKALRTTPMLEIRKGNDLIVAGVYGFLAGGPTLATAKGQTVAGGSARGGFGAEFRRHKFWGLTLRFEGGVDYIDAHASGVFATLLGVQFSRPARPVE